MDKLEHELSSLLVQPGLEPCGQRTSHSGAICTERQAAVALFISRL